MSTKFDAARVHFEKKRVELNKEIKSLNHQLDNAHADCQLFKSRYELAERECEELKKMIESLLKHSNLTQADVKKLCEHDNNMLAAITWLENFVDMSKLYQGGSK